MKLSAYFTLDEFLFSQTAARNGIENIPSADEFLNLQHTAIQMDEVRRLLGKPVLVSSGYRSAALNKAIGGSKTSSHMSGNAVDFTCPTFGTPSQVFERLRHSGLIFDQIICEMGQWVHIGFGAKSRGQCLTWNGSEYNEVA